MVVVLAGKVAGVSLCVQEIEQTRKGECTKMQEMRK